MPVGIDGSPESEVTLRSAVEMFGTRIGLLVLARVVDFDRTSQQTRENAERAARLLEASTDAHKPGTILLSGQPAVALTKDTSEEGYELLVIGRRGRGRATLSSQAPPREWLTGRTFPCSSCGASH